LPRTGHIAHTYTNPSRQASTHQRYRSEAMSFSHVY
jgi:hypothetical protein